MGRRQRQRAREGRGGDEPLPELEPATYSAADGAELVLRASLSPASRRRYAEILAGSLLSREDAWHNAVQFLFERLAISWTIAGAPIVRQEELLARLRVASEGERHWVRDTLRAHCAEHFPELQAP